MASGSYRSTADRRRGTSLLLTIAAHALLLLLLLRLAPPMSRPQSDNRTLSTFDVASVSPQHATAKAERQKVVKREVQRKPSSPPPPDRPVTPPIPKAKLPSDFINLSDAEMASSDVSRMRSADAGTGSSNGSGDGDSKAPYGPGAGPGGKTLYAAQWYREPTNAELNGYLPPNRPNGSWGMIACQTVPDYRVDNCRQLDESPAGSGLSRAMRQAAWQFRVRPPRIGGKPVIGAWVSIRIDITQKGEAVAG